MSWAAVAALLGCALAPAPALGARGASDDEAWKDRPVTRVVQLLKDMQAQLGKEAQADEELYDKLACWCEQNQKEKTKSIADNQERSASLESSIDEFGAKATGLSTEIGSLKEEIATNENALGKADAIREKEVGEFNNAEKDLVASISSLKGAVLTIESGRRGAALLQHSQAQDALGKVAQELRKHPKMVNAALMLSKRKRFADFLSAAQDGAKTAAFLQQQQPAASGEIFGMLKQMKETFESNLESSRKDENHAAKGYSEMKTAKQLELKASNKQMDEKSEEFADMQENHAQAKMQLRETTRTLDSDQQFMMTLKKKCSISDEDWQARQKTRQEELAAVSDTIALLSGDDARDLFSKSLGLLQARATSRRNAGERAKAAAMLQEIAMRHNSPRLLYAAMQVRSDVLNSLDKGLDQMVSAMDQEAQNEIDKKDYCAGAFHKNEGETTAHSDHKEELDTDIASLEADVNQIGEEVQANKQKIADMQVTMKKASENREAENKDYQMTVADQRATQTILKKAAERLGEFYSKKSASLLQEKQAPPGPSASYKAVGGGGAVALIEGIISDAKQVEGDAIHAEQDAQAAYEEFVKDTNKSIKAIQDQIVDQTEDLAKDVQAEVADKSDQKSEVDAILHLGEEGAALHSDCDFTVNNFETRQHAREDEMDALKEAKAMIHGADLSL